MNNKIITIDGPSASGKGTIAKKIANILGFEYLDSGALYRIIAYIAYQIFGNNINSQNIKEYESIILDQFKQSNINFEQDKILLDNIDITKFIRSENIGNIASILAGSQNIRLALLDWQRKYATSKGLVTDGRDMGTVVFPDAKCKIFLVADVNKRAKRRYQQLIEQQAQNQSIKLEDILLNLQQRDERDINRVNSPLKPAPNAFILDNSDLTIEKTIELVLEYYNIAKCIKD